MRENEHLAIIKKNLLTEFEFKLFDAALYNLNDSDNQLRFSNYAYALRELFLHVIKRMAPDDYVRCCEWYPGDNEYKQVPRVATYKYIIHGGLSDDFVSSVLKLDLKETFSKLKNAFLELNKFTHINEKVFPLDDVLGFQILLKVEELLSSLFIRLNECHGLTIESIEEHINRAVVHAGLFETIESIDELSSHSSLEGIDVEDIKVVDLDYSNISFCVTGTVDVGLQWGSNSDVKNDMGAIGSESFPFQCELTSSVGDPYNLEYGESSFTVDTSQWWDNYYD
ncbi:pPIWI-associating nuclease domain-containing protein [Buttiauxella agrestis]|uniref:pPIWI-associating nuclease domain-containing protein n=1 Tax=Buttiauxella agrestis TaxID=82977 RepID=UPI0039750A24